MTTELAKLPQRGTGDVLLELFGAGAESPADLAELRRRVRFFLRRRPGFSLDQCVGVATEGARQLNRRRYLVREALALVDGASSTARCESLAGDVHYFLSRGPATAWRKAGGPPADASELQHVIFEICKTLKPGKSISAKTIGRMVMESIAEVGGTNFPMEVSRRSEQTGHMQTSAATAPAAMPTDTEHEHAR